MSSVYKKTDNLEVIEKNIKDAVITQEGEKEVKSPVEVEGVYTFDKLLTDLFNFAAWRDLEGLSSPDNAIKISFKINETELDISLSYQMLSIIDKSANDIMIFGDSVCKADILEGAAANADIIARAATVLRGVK